MVKLGKMKWTGHKDNACQIWLALQDELKFFQPAFTDTQVNRRMFCIISHKCTAIRQMKTKSTKYTIEDAK